MSKYFYSDGKVSVRRPTGYSQLPTNPKTHMRALKKAERLEEKNEMLKALIEYTVNYFVDRENEKHLVLSRLKEIGG